MALLLLVFSLVTLDFGWREREGETWVWVWSGLKPAVWVCGFVLWEVLCLVFAGDVSVSKLIGVHLIEPSTFQPSNAEKTSRGRIR